MNSYERRQYAKQIARGVRKERDRQAKVATADRVISRLVRAYTEVYGIGTCPTYDAETGLYTWRGQRMQRVTMERYARKLEARAAALINPDEENS